MLADKHHRKVRITGSWNQLFLLEMNSIYSTNAIAFFLFYANYIARLYLLSIELFSKQYTIFRQHKNYRKAGDFQANFL